MDGVYGITSSGVVCYLIIGKEKAHTPEIAKVIDDAMRLIEEDNPKLKMYYQRTMQIQTWIRWY